MFLQVNRTVLRAIINKVSHSGVLFACASLCPDLRIANLSFSWELKRLIRREAGRTAGFSAICDLFTRSCRENSEKEKGHLFYPMRKNIIIPSYTFRDR